MRTFSETTKNILKDYLTEIDEMFTEPQRDITPEQNPAILRNLSTIHYKKK